jgi:hypothetical protein
MSDVAPRVDVPSAIARLVGPAAIVALVGSHATIAALVTAVVTEIIPNRRVRRLETLFEKLNDRVSELTSAPLAVPVDDDERVTLLEDGMWQAVRASSPDRIGYIANILANGLTAADARCEDRRYLMQLLDELNDVEVLVLCATGRDTMQAASDFYERHDAALGYKRANFNDPPEVMDRQAVRENYEDHLTRLGLLKEVYHKPYQKPLELDQEGKPKGIYRQLSWLGRYLLREIGQPADH